MKRTKIISLIVALLAVVVLSTFAVRSFFKVDPPKTVTVILKSEKVSEFWSEVISGIERFGAEENIEYDFVSSIDENDVNGQIEIIQEVISRKPDGIILAASDYYKLADMTAKILDADIELVLIDSGVRGNDFDSIVATDNYKAGYDGALQLMRYLEAPKHIVLVNHVQSSLTAIEREQGARDALIEEYGDITVEIFYCNDDPAAAYDYIERLHRYGVEIDGIIGLNERSTVGAARFLDEHEEASHIPIVGFDSSVEEIQLLEKEVVKALVIQQPFSMGYTAMKTLSEVIEHSKVAKNIDTGALIITKDNMYDQENQVILFPFNRE